MAPRTASSHQFRYENRKSASSGHFAQARYGGQNSEDSVLIEILARARFGCSFPCNGRSICACKRQRILTCGWLFRNGPGHSNTGGRAHGIPRSFTSLVPATTEGSPDDRFSIEGSGRLHDHLQLLPLRAPWAGHAGHWVGPPQLRDSGARFRAWAGNSEIVDLRVAPGVGGEFPGGPGANEHFGPRNLSRRLGHRQCRAVRLRSSPRNS
jgi:hypothetical protein